LNRNQFVIDAEIISSDTLRHTPAGIPALAVTLRHESQQVEAGKPATVQFQMPAMAYGVVAMELAEVHPGERVTFKGFMNRKNRFSDAPILHITEFKTLN
jgi:primosomal replication protein N